MKQPIQEAATRVFSGLSEAAGPYMVACKKVNYQRGARRIITEATGEAQSDEDEDMLNWMDNHGIRPLPAKPSDVWYRVVWGQQVPESIETTEPDSLGYPEGFGTFWGIHVTTEPDFWIEMLAIDYKRPRDQAHVIKIKVLPSDRFIRDRQYKPKGKAAGSRKASSAVLLTTRATLKRGIDYEEVKTTGGKYQQTKHGTLRKVDEDDVSTGFSLSLDEVEFGGQPDGLDV